MQERPEPISAGATERWQRQSLRWRMLHGKWQQDAERRLQTFFHRDVWEFLPPASTAMNVHLALTSQTATLYDEGVSLQTVGRKPAQAAIDQLDLDTLWAHMQDALLHVRGMNEAFVRRSWDAERGRVRYRVVTPDCVDDEARGDDPTQPDLIRHLVLRDGEYQWEVYDRQTWTFSVHRPHENEQMREKDPLGIDITTQVFPELAEVDGRWPLWTGGRPGAGEPIWMWTKYHSRIGSHLHNSTEGHEVVDGTLTVAALWTFWIGGLRDAAFEQRWIANGEIAGAGSSAGQGHIPANPMTVLMLKSLGGPATTVQAGSWSSPLDVLNTAQAIALWAASLGLFAGLSAADVSVSGQGLSRTSGVAIEVSRSGKRKIEQKMRRPMLRGDQLNLAGAAQIANAYGPSSSTLPEEPEAYRVVYAQTPRTVQELQAEVAEVTQLTEAGLMHRAEALMRLNPQMTLEEAEQRSLEIATFMALWDEVRQGRMPTAPEGDADVRRREPGPDSDAAEPDAEPEPDDDAEE